MSKSRNKVELENNRGRPGVYGAQVDRHPGEQCEMSEPDMDSIKRHIRRELATITNNKNNKTNSNIQKGYQTAEIKTNRRAK